MSYSLCFFLFFSNLFLLIFTSDCHEFEPSIQAMDEEAAKKLWEISEELVKLPKELGTQTS